MVGYENIEDIIASIDSFNPTQEQIEAISSRNYLKAVSLGITLDQYMSRV